MKKLFTIGVALTIFFQTHAQIEKMMIGDNNNGQIVTSTLTGGNLDTITTSYFSFYDADVDKANEKVYTAWYYGIYRMNFDGSGVDTIVDYPTGGYSDGITIDERNGKIYWTSTPEDLILTANLDGSAMDTLLEVPASYYLTDIDIDTVNNHFYFGSWITSGKGVFRCNLDGTGLDTVILGMDCQYLGLNTAQSQLLYSNNSEVRRINFNSTGDISMFSFQPGGMIFNENNNLWYISDMTNSRIVTCDNDGNNFNTYLTGSLDSPHGPVFVSYSNASVSEPDFFNYNLYPNPTNGDFYLNLGENYENSVITITDITGKMVETRSVIQSQILNLHLDEPAGIYFVSIQTGDHHEVIRLVKN